MYCTKCGRPIEDGAQFCSYCGTRAFDENEFKRYNHFQISKRSIPVCIILSIVTFGIYGLYWMYSIANDVNTLVGDDSTSGAKVLIFSIITLGIYELYWLYKVGERLSNFKYQQGIMDDHYRSLIYLILSLLGWDIIAWALIQNDLNQYAQD